MKATITFEGVGIALEDVTGAEVRDLIFALKDGPARPAKKRGRPVEHVTVEELTDSQLQTWRYLTAHDTEEGIHYGEYAKAATLSVPVAENRIKKLESLGLAHKVGPARYRAGSATPED